MFAGPSSSASILQMGEDTQVMIVKDILTQPGARLLQHLSSRDLALISLHEPLSFSPALGAVCISRGEEHEEEQCVIVGWSKEANGNKLDIIQHIIDILLLNAGTEFSMLKVDSTYSIISDHISNCNSSYIFDSEKLHDEKTCIETNCQVCKTTSNYICFVKCILSTVRCRLPADVPQWSPGLVTPGDPEQARQLRPGHQHQARCVHEDGVGSVLDREHHTSPEITN